VSVVEYENATSYTFSQNKPVKEERDDVWIALTGDEELTIKHLGKSGDGYILKPMGVGSIEGLS